MGLGTGGGHVQFCGAAGPHSLPWVMSTKLPGPEMEPVSKGLRFSVTPQWVNAGMVSRPLSGPPVGTVYPFGGTVLSPLPTSVSRGELTGLQCGPIASGTPLTSTSEIWILTLVVARTVIG